MFSAMRRRIRFSPATVIAGLALVFAMTGGAYAAKKYLITSTKQISPSVLKQLQGKAGPGAVGAQGAQGPAGPVGPAGPAGSGGAKGETGPAGAKGENGLQGEKGVEGKKGATGPAGATGATGVSGFTETLPSGKTETGTWSLRGEPTKEVAVSVVPISFAIPLAHGGVNGSSATKAFLFTEEQVREGEFGENKTTHKSCVVGSSSECVDTGCHWAQESVEARPEAKVPGTLCVFVQYGELENLESSIFQVPGEVLENGYGPSGSYLYFVKKSTSGTPERQSAVGTWAVTAP